MMMNWNKGLMSYLMNVQLTFSALREFYVDLGSYTSPNTFENIFEVQNDVCHVEHNVCRYAQDKGCSIHMSFLVEK